MMKKSILVLFVAVIFSVGITGYLWTFIGNQIEHTTLTEETILGNREAAADLSVGFSADSAGNLHWQNEFDYNTNQTETIFSKGETVNTEAYSVYEDMRFNGWSTVPFTTQLNYAGLEGLQDKAIHQFYEDIQQKVLKVQTTEEGKIRLKDYLDYYPISFQFQFGTKRYNSDNALIGMKAYDRKGALQEDSGTAYDRDVDLYVALNQMIKIPVIQEEYHEYKVYRSEEVDGKTTLEYQSQVRKRSGEGEDYYQFDPILVIQEENLLDGKKWEHPDLTEEQPAETVDENEDAYLGKSAAEFRLKNRMLFAVNNRTAKGAAIDVSQIGEGFGIYELPIEVTATATIRKGARSTTVPDPKPASDQLKLVYPLDEQAEYVEMSLSDDHRYLAVFSVKEGAYLVEVIDADHWTSNGATEIFPASETMSYAWGEEGSLVATNHQGHIAVLTRAGDTETPYEILYSGKVKEEIIEAFFDEDMVEKEHAISSYRYGIGQGLTVASKDGKVALVQNLLINKGEFSFRNAGLVCAIIDQSGIRYMGQMKSNMVDLDDEISANQLQAIRDALGDEVNHIIKPVRSENWSKWK
ncbi:hypothetical protein M2140_001659 [Clostridiales Family XIII bacterium PM5-7]